jgi:hypothetical protein
MVDTYQYFQRQEPQHRTRLKQACGALGTELRGSLLRLITGIPIEEDQPKDLLPNLIFIAPERTTVIDTGGQVMPVQDVPAAAFAEVAPVDLGEVLGRVGQHLDLDSLDGTALAHFLTTKAQHPAAMATLEYMADVLLGQYQYPLNNTEAIKVAACNSTAEWFEGWAKMCSL